MRVIKPLLFLGISGNQIVQATFNQNILLQAVIREKKEQLSLKLKTGTR